MFVITGCGGSSNSGTLSIDGTYSGSIVLSSPAQTTTGELLFLSPFTTFTGTWTDGGDTRQISGSGNDTSVTITLQTSGASRSFSGQLSVNSANHLVGTLSESVTLATLKIDMVKSS